MCSSLSSTSIWRENGFHIKNIELSVLYLGQNWDIVLQYVNVACYTIRMGSINVDYITESSESLDTPQLRSMHKHNGIILL